MTGRASTSTRQATIAALRRRLRATAAALTPAAPPVTTVKLRIPEVDDCFRTGGLPVGAVQELWATRPSHRAAVMGFALGLLHHLASGQHGARRGGDFVWIYLRGQVSEWGLPYGPGLMAFGHDPGRFILVEARNTLEALWAGEETLRADTPAGVVIALDAGYHRHAFMATRRFELAARAGGANGLLLCAGTDPPASAASLRWRVAPAPVTAAARAAARPPPFPARPRWRLVLERNRLGSTGAWNLEWNHESCIFLQPTAVPRPVAAPLAGRAGTAAIHRLAGAGA